MSPVEPEVTLADVDVDGALRETAGRLPTRRTFLAAAGAGAAALAMSPGAALAAGRLPDANDYAILNFALALEYLQAAFYTEAQRVGALRGGLAEQARVVGAHERAHVEAIRGQLGRRAIASPRFDFHGVTDSPERFRAAAVALEDLAVGAYKEQLPLIYSDSYLAAATAIHSVEARHAAWIRRLAGVIPAQHAFDPPVADGRAVALVNSTHFVSLTAPDTSARLKPRFTG